MKRERKRKAASSMRDEKGNEHFPRTGGKKKHTLLQWQEWGRGEKGVVSGQIYAGRKEIHQVQGAAALQDKGKRKGEERLLASLWQGQGKKKKPVEDGPAHRKKRELGEKKAKRISRRPRGSNPTQLAHREQTNKSFDEKKR